LNAGTSGVTDPKSNRLPLQGTSVSMGQSISRRRSRCAGRAGICHCEMPTGRRLDRRVPDL